MFGAHTIFNCNKIAFSSCAKIVKKQLFRIVFFKNMNFDKNMEFPEASINPSHEINSKPAVFEIWSSKVCNCRRVKSIRCIFYATLPGQPKRHSRSKNRLTRGFGEHFGHLRGKNHIKRLFCGILRMCCKNAIICVVASKVMRAYAYPRRRIPQVIKTHTIW